MADKAGLKQLADLDDAAFAAAHLALDGSIRATLGVANAVAAFRSEGSTAPAEVARQLDAWEGRLGIAQA